LAIDFAGLVSIAQIKKSEKTAVEKYGITEFPSLILLQPGSEEAIKFDGKVEKDAMVKFLSQVAPPNPDCPPPKEKKAKAKKDTKKDAKSSSKFSKASESHKSADASSAAASATDETVEEPVVPTESPNPNLKDADTPEPIELPKEEVKPTIPVLSEASEVQALCLNEASKTCILAILPKDESSEAAQTAVSSLAIIHKKHDTRTGHLFPFVGVTASNPVAASLLSSLSLGSDDQVHLIATHGKRAWYKKYAGSAFGIEEVEQWVDAIRMGEGKKDKLPESLIVAGEKVPAEEPVQINIEDITEDGATPEHNEL
jgi:protein disulfide-isomerase A6